MHSACCFDAQAPTERLSPVCHSVPAGSEDWCVITAGAFGKPISLTIDEFKNTVEGRILASVVVIPIKIDMCFPWARLPPFL